MTTELSAVYSLFDHLSDGFCLATAGGDVLYMNEAAQRLLDISGPQRQLANLCRLLCERLQQDGAQASGLTCPLLDAADPAQAVTFVGKHGPRQSFNWRDDRVHRAERYRDLRVRCLRTKLPLAGVNNEELHVVLIEDASHEMELKRHRADWRSMIAHDLRAPIAAVFSSLRLLEEKTADPKERDDILQLALRNCRRMIELLDLYLDVAQFDAGMTKMRLEALDLAGLVADAVEEQSPLASDHGVTVELELAAGLKARADRDMLSRVVENLLNNAIKYNVKGGRVRITALEDEHGVLLTFKDTGRGIAETDLPRIFDRYYQAEARRAGRIKGNGLGLTFCKEALALMGGEIAVASKVGEGSEFLVRLPAGGAP